jgi:hypothetical protein
LIFFFFFFSLRLGTKNQFRIYSTATTILLSFFLHWRKERGRYVLPKESPAQVYLAQADFEMRIGGLSTALGLLNKVLLLLFTDAIPLCKKKSLVYFLYSTLYLTSQVKSRVYGLYFLPFYF